MSSLRIPLQDTTNLDPKFDFHDDSCNEDEHGMFCSEGMTGPTLTKTLTLPWSSVRGVIEVLYIPHYNFLVDLLKFVKILLISYFVVLVV